MGWKLHLKKYRPAIQQSADREHSHKSSKSIASLENDDEVKGLLARSRATKAAASDKSADAAQGRKGETDSMKHGTQYESELNVGQSWDMG